MVSARLMPSPHKARQGIGYGITQKLSKSKYKIRYNFMGSGLVFQFLDINALNYCYFHTDCLTFFNNKKTLEKFKKNVKNAFL